MKIFRELIDMFGGRKLLVLLIATALLCFGVIDQETFKWVAMSYMGANAVIAGARAFSPNNREK